MSDFDVPPFFVLVLVVVTAALTWIATHGVVATECKKLGAFYVGSEVFECKVKP